VANRSIRDRLERLVIANSRLDLAAVADGDRLDFDLGYDSHALLNLLLDVEDAFGIEVPPAKVPELIGAPFGELVALVERQRPTDAPTDAEVAR